MACCTSDVSDAAAEGVDTVAAGLAVGGWFAVSLDEPASDEGRSFTASSPLTQSAGLIGC